MDAQRARRAVVDWLRDLPFAIRVGEDDNQLLVVHANPQNDDEHLWPDADESVLERMIGDEKATAIAFGHLQSAVRAHLAR